MYYIGKRNMTTQLSGDIVDKTKTKYSSSRYYIQIVPQLELAGLLILIIEVHFTYRY